MRVGSPLMRPTSQVSPLGVRVNTVVSASQANSRAVFDDTGPLPACSWALSASVT